MSDKLKLIKLYNNHIKMPLQDKRYKTIIYKITDIMVTGLCRKSGLFEKLSRNCRPFLRGAHWDGLHCAQDQEADAYLVLDLRNVDNNVSLLFGAPSEFPNFAHLKLDHKPSTWDLRNICVSVGDSWFVSPLLLFRDMVSSVEDFLVEYDYKISLSVDQSSASEDEKGFKAGSGGWEIVILEVSFKIDSGLTLTFRAPQLQEITISLFPAFRFPVTKLDDPQVLHTLGYIRSISNQKEFILEEALAVCLHKVHSAKFQISFYNYERALLFSRSFCKLIIRLIKFVISNYKLYLETVSSEAVKALVMFMVVNDYDRLHANFEVERNFLYCFKRLKDVICNGGRIRDIFFRKLDMLRIKNPVIKDIVKTIISQIYYSLKAGETKTLLGPEAAKFGYTCILCSRQYKNLSRHVSMSHKYSFVTSADLATTFAFPEDIAEIMEDVLAVPASTRQILRKCQYCNETFVCKCRLETHKLEHHFRQHNTEFLDKLSKEVLCPHCCQILEDKCRLLRHIFLEHPTWAGPAMIALKERSHFYEWGLAAITNEKPNRVYV